MSKRYRYQKQQRRKPERKKSESEEKKPQEIIQEQQGLNNSHQILRKRYFDIDKKNIAILRKRKQLNIVGKFLSLRLKRAERVLKDQRILILITNRIPQLTPYQHPQPPPIQQDVAPQQQTKIDLFNLMKLNGWNPVYDSPFEQIQAFMEELLQSLHIQFSLAVQGFEDKGTKIQERKYYLARNTQIIKEKINELEIEAENRKKRSQD